MDRLAPKECSPEIVLILPIHNDGLRILSLLAEAMMKDGRLEPCMVTTDNWVAQLLQAPDYTHLPKVDMHFPHIRVPWDKTPHEQETGLSLKTSFFRGLSKLIPECAFEIWWRRRWYKQYYEKALKLIKQARPLAVVTIDDRRPSTIPILKAARDMGVATLVVPVAVSAFSKSLAAIRSTQPDKDLNNPKQRILKHWVARHYPNQVLTAGKGRYLYYPPSNTIALAACGMLPDNPFSIGGGLAQKVAVGEDDKKRLVKDGLEPHKVVVTGDPGSDRLYQVYRQKESLRAKYVADYQINPEARILVCAVPQFGEHGRVPWERHWKIIRELVGTLAASGQTVILSLHPKAELANYRFLEDTPGVKIAREPLMNFLPCADIFISGFSSTVRWAVLSRVPTIVLDLLGKSEPLFTHINGVMHLGGETVFRDLSKQLRILLDNPAKTQQVKQMLAEEALNVAPFDGRANQRILELIITMSSENT